MEKFDQKMIDERDAIANRWKKAEDVLDGVIDEINKLVRERLSSAIMEHNEAVAAAIGFIERQTGEMQVHSGQNPSDDDYAVWQSDWSNASTEPVELVGELDKPERQADDFARLDTEPQR